MKWTAEQAAELYAMCVNGQTNKQMAAHFAVMPAEIRAKRRKLGLTHKKVAEIRDKRLDDIMNQRGDMI